MRIQKQCEELVKLNKKNMVMKEEEITGLKEYQMLIQEECNKLLNQILEKNALETLTAVNNINQKVEALQATNNSLYERVDELSKENNDLNAELSSLHQELVQKEEQIAHNDVELSKRIKLGQSPGANCAICAYLKMGVLHLGPLQKCCPYHP